MGWFIGSKEQEYSASFYEKYGQRMYHELLFEIQREISQRKGELNRIILDYLDNKEG